jgi:hypothetical protein
VAWENCPFAEVDCPYPGECGRYVDVDHDAVCDYSQAKPEDRAIYLEVENNNLTTESEMKTIRDITLFYNISPIKYIEILSIYYEVEVQLNDEIQFLSNTHDLKLDNLKKIAKSMKTFFSTKDINKIEKPKRDYHLVPIFIFLML